MTCWDTLGALLHVVRTIGLVASGAVVANRSYAQYVGGDCPDDLLALWDVPNADVVRIALLALAGTGTALALLPPSCVARQRRLAGSLIASSTSGI